MIIASFYRKAVSVLLSIVIALSLVPSFAHADTDSSVQHEAVSNGASGEQNQEATNASSEATVGNGESVSEEKASGVSGSNQEQQEQPTLSFLAANDTTDQKGDGSSAGEIGDRANSWRYIDGEQVFSYEGASTEATDLHVPVPFAAAPGASSYATWNKSNGTTSYTYKANPSDTGQNVAVGSVKRVGIDVSYHQGTIDWAKVKSSGVTFAIIRCGYGSDFASQDDTQFLNNVRGAQANGIDIGIYLYSYALDVTGSDSSAASEAQHVLRLLEEANLGPDDLAYPVFYDLEDKTQENLGTVKLGQMAKTFCDAVSEQGYKVGIYANQNWWKNYLTDSVFSSAGWHKWVARYPGSNKATDSGVSGTEIWQFSDCGNVDGISGNCDMNFDYVGSYNGVPDSAFVSYSVHAQDAGWKASVWDGITAGSVSDSKRIEALRIELGGGVHDQYTGSIQYRAQVQTYGWQDWLSEGEIAGTTGEAKRLEAVQIQLSGDVAKRYDVYYRVYVSSVGWLDWGKNGGVAGTEGYGYQVEAIEIKLALKGSAAPGDVSTPYLKKNEQVSYSAHVQGVGWQSSVYDGIAAGVVEQARGLEALKVSLSKDVLSSFSGSIQYRTQVQTYGWQDWAQDGQISGTEGQAKRLEAIQIKLTGDLAAKYDVYYRAHAQTYGWMGWAKNGESAGTEGLAKRLEALEVVLLPKGQTPGDYDAGQSAFEHIYLSATAHVQTYGTQTYTTLSASESMVLGVINQAKRLESISLSASGYANDGIEGSIQYRTQVQTYGWQDWAQDGQISGTEGQAKRLEAIQIKLTGDLAAKYDVYYRAHAQTYGWMGWAKNGESAGTEGLAKRLEALEVVLLPKGQTPGDYDAGQSAFEEAMIRGSAQVQTYGWVNNATPSLETSLLLGTTGCGKRLEAVAVDLLDTLNSEVEYQVHVQTYGWTEWKSGGQVAGTEGESKRLEAVQFNLKGDLAADYDIYYRAHVSDIGWLGWAKNGESAGTESCKATLEAIEIVFVKKGSPAPGSTDLSFVDGDDLPITVDCGGLSAGSGNWSTVGLGQIVGTTGQSKVLTGVKLAAQGKGISGGITYSTHVAKHGWLNFSSDGQMSQNGSNAVQALRISLTGDLSKYFDIYYRAHVSGYGWMGWAKNGSPIGTTGLSKNMEAYQVVVVLKGTEAPGSMAKSFSDENGFLGVPAKYRPYVNKAQGYSSGTNYLILVDRGNHKVVVFSGSTNHWSLRHYWNCVTGAPGSPTITGSYYTTGYKRTSLSTDSRAIWCTQIWGGYFFHSILASENELGHSLSHGCIRLPYSAASWIYNNIYAGTRVVIYN